MTTMRRLTEHIVRQAAKCLHGREALPLPAPGQGRTGTTGVDLVDISAPWPVVTVLGAVSRAVGRTVTLDTDLDVLLGIAKTHGVTVRPEMGPGAVVEELYAQLVEPMTMPPTFYTDFPVETSPADPSPPVDTRSRGALGPRHRRDGDRHGIQRAHRPPGPACASHRAVHESGRWRPGGDGGR